MVESSDSTCAMGSGLASEGQQEIQRELPKGVSKNVWDWGVKREGALGSQVPHHVSNLKILGLQLSILYILYLHVDYIHRKSD